jgi:RNA polymerase sigma-70 factor (ECF subfamily)
MEDRTSQDLSLVNSILQGDQAAFGELVARYQRLVASAAWRYGIGQSEIEDVVSEVFIKAYQNLHQFRPEHSFSTWLYRLAVNHVIDHSRRRRKERGRTEMPQQLTDPSPTAAEDVDAHERAKLLRKVLEEVKPHYRDVLFLVYVEGLKVDETARVLGLPEGTVKTRLMRGRTAMRRILVSRYPEHFGGPQ